MKIGFIGLGHMGQAMAGRLLQQGHEVVVFNRTLDKAQPLRDKGATVARSVADACQADAVITMVSDDAAVDGIVFGDDGLLRHLPDASIHISSSTISVGMAERLARAHAEARKRFVAAPVLGRPEAAENGLLFVLAAGEQSLLDCVEPVFRALGQRAFVISERPEHALLVKLASNFLIASVMESLGEAMALVEKGNVDPHRFVAIVTSSLFDAPVYRTYGDLIADRKFAPPQFAAALGEKDVRLGLQAAEDLRVPMPIANLIHDRFLRLLAHDEAVDWSAIGGLAADDAGILRT
ncbi:MAG: NAD(P)-dependent oxidoreductase [Kofleriaceae bacterium]|nr:NAD(P)-dependent oxidoreductase [Kofleriaceae bacterium]